MVILPIEGEHLRYHVQSESRGEKILHVVDVLENACSCEDFGFRKRRCKHLRAARDMALDDLLQRISKEHGFLEQPKKEKEDTEYGTAARSFLRENMTCGLCPHPSEHIHHSRGRIGDLLMDRRFWVPLCRECHRWVHDNPTQARTLDWKGVPILAAPGNWNRIES